jgi:hypothetical protein
MLVIVVLANLLANTTAYAGSMAGVRSINNEERNIDYKVSPEYLKQVSDKLNTGTTEREVIDTSPARDTTGLTTAGLGTEAKASSDDLFGLQNYPTKQTIGDKELSWLIDHNIVSREGTVTIGSSVVEVSKGEPLFDRNVSEPMGKSEFLVGVYKSLYGVLPSRTMIFNTSSWRDASQIFYKRNSKGELIKSYGSRGRQIVSGGGSEYLYLPADKKVEQESTFPKGDFLTYVTPTVYELYLKELVDKNIVNIANLKDTDFKTAYKELAKNNNGRKLYPQWYNKLSPYIAMTGATQSNGEVFDVIPGTSPLGKGYTFDVSGGMSIYKKVPDYFVQEETDTITALRYLEAMLRGTEKDMTDTEAKIVTYKYGASYLNKLVDADRKTVMFLTAKGILNFEDPNEYKNFYGKLSKDFAYKMMYRVANKEARLNFSKIQLTDSDNFWIGKGFTQLNLEFSLEDPSKKAVIDLATGSGVSIIPDVQTKSVMPEGKVSLVGSEKTFSFFGIKFTTKKSKFAAPETTATQPFIVEKVFDDKRKYMYNNMLLTDPELKAKNPEIIEEPEVLDGEYQTKIKFKVDAMSGAMAVGTVDSNLQISTNGLFTTKGINAVTKYTDKGEQKILVPASTFKDLGTEIVILEDKLLKNTQTGVTAVLLPDNNLALVGTNVISSESAMVFAINNEVFYDLEIIKSLMSNAYLSKIDPFKIYVSDKITSENEQLVDVVGSTGNRIGRTYVTKFKGQFDGGGDTSSMAPVTEKSFLNISQLTTASNFLIKKFQTKSNGQEVSVRVILHFAYRVPGSDDNFSNPIYDSDSPTIDDVNKFFFTKPQDPQLADWWDNNLAMSNAFANVFYGTKGKSYVKSGYMMPNVTILYDNEADAQQTKFISDLFAQVGAQLPKEWVNKFIGDLPSYNKVVGWDKPTEAELVIGTLMDDAVNAGGKFYPPKELPAKVFPKWVHTMFNNEGYKVTTVSIGESTSLWKYLMAQRTLNYTPEITIGKQSTKVYKSGNIYYVVTGADTVYKMIDDGDPNFKPKYDEASKSIKIQTRTDSDQRTSWTGKYVTLGTNKFYVAGLTDNKLILVDTAKVNGVMASTTRKGKSSFTMGGSLLKEGSTTPEGLTGDALSARYNQLRSELVSPTNGAGYDKAVTAYETAEAVTGTLPRESMIDSYYFVDIDAESGYDGTVKPFFAYEELNAGVGPVIGRSLVDIANAPASAHIRLDVDLSYWKVNNDGGLEARRTLPYLLIGNVHYSGVNQGLIDSIIANSLKMTKPSELEDGSTLLIDDIEFIKDGKTFVSNPNNNLASLDEYKNRFNIAGVASEFVLKQFSGLSVQVSNRQIPLVSFVSNAGLGVPPKLMNNFDKALVGDAASADRAFVTTDVGGKRTSVKYDPVNVPQFNSVVMKVELDDTLLARKVDTTTKTYQLMFSTNSLSEGFVKDSPFFNESLSLKSTDDLALMVSKMAFKPLAQAAELKDKFLQTYQQAFKGDLLSLLKMIFITILSFLIIISWICYPVVNHGLGIGLVEALKNPIRGSDRNGFDIIKVISLGMYDSESRIAEAKIGISNLLMFVMIYVLLDVI